MCARQGRKDISQSIDYWMRFTIFGTRNEKRHSKDAMDEHEKAKLKIYSEKNAKFQVSFCNSF